MMWSQIQYDENLNENPFFREILRSHKDIIEKAVENSWIICVPRVGNLESSQITSEVILDHVIIPQDEEDFENAYSSLSKKALKVKNKHIIIKDNPKDESSIFNINSVQILFEETFYLEDKTKYTVWCIDKPLFCEENPPSFTEERSLRSIHDCVDFLWNECIGCNVFEQIQDITNNFLQRNDDFVFESLQAQKDLLGSIYSQCLQVVLRNEEINIKATENAVFLDNLKISVECYMQSCLYKKIFAGLGTNTCERDAHLNKIIQNSGDVQSGDLGITEEYSEIITCAKYELGKLNQYGTILDKMNCLKCTFHCMSNNNVSPRGTYLSSDMLLQLFIYVILKLQINNWSANLLYMKTLQFNSLNLLNENDYVISTLEAALEYIKSSEFANIRAKLQSNGGGTAEDRISSRSPLSEKLFNYIKQGDLKEVSRILNDNENLTYIEKTDKLCHPLCSCDHCLELLKDICRISSINVNSCNDKEQSLLHVAALNSHCDIIDYLVRKNANINAQDFLGQTPLHYAASRGLQDVLLLLINLNCSVNAKDNNGNTPLALASNNGHENCVKALIYSSHHIEVNTKNNYGDGPLHFASKWGYIGIVQILLENNAFPNVPNKRNETPVELSHNFYITRLLEQFSLFDTDSYVSNTSQESFAEIEQKSYNFLGKEHGNRPRSPEQAKKIELLLKAIQNNDLPLTCFYLGFCSVKTVDHYEIEKKCHPLCTCVKCYILEKDFEIITIPKPTEYINVNFCNSEGYTPLHVAATYGRTDILRLLLDSGALPNLKTYKKLYTPLHLACINQRLQVVKELVLSSRCDLNSVDIAGNTPLYYACMRNDTRMAEILLSNGADCYNRNKSGKTILQEVQDKMLYGIFKLLRDHARLNLDKAYEDNLFL